VCGFYLLCGVSKFLYHLYLVLVEAIADVLVKDGHYASAGLEYDYLFHNYEEMPHLYTDSVHILNAKRTWQGRYGM
jgi:hypothetical protein